MSVAQNGIKEILKKYPKMESVEKLLSADSDFRNLFGIEIDAELRKSLDLSHIKEKTEDISILAKKYWDDDSDKVAFVSMFLESDKIIRAYREELKKELENKTFEINDDFEKLFGDEDAENQEDLDTQSNFDDLPLHSIAEDDPKEDNMKAKKVNTIDEMFDEPKESPKKKPNKATSNVKKIVAGTILLMVAVLGYFFYSILSDVLNGKVATKGNTGEKGNASSAIIVKPAKELPESGFVVSSAPPKEIDYSSKFASKANEPKAKEPKAKEANAGNKISQNHQEKISQNKKQNEANIDNTNIVKSDIGTRGSKPTPEKQIVQASSTERKTKKENTEYYPPIPAENIKEGGICNTVPEYYRSKDNRYVYYIKKGYEYIPAYQTKEWRGDTIEITDRVVGLSIDNANGMVEVSDGKFLPIELFTSCDIVEQ